MERSVAIKKLGKLLGKKLGYRVDNNAPTKDERAAAKAELSAAITERNELQKRRDERYKAILAADVEYQTLHAAHRAAYERANELSAIVQQRKITVGELEHGFFLVKATGDSWEDVIETLTAKTREPV